MLFEPRLARGNLSAEHCRLLCEMRLMRLTTALFDLFTAFGFVLKSSFDLEMVHLHVYLTYLLLACVRACTYISH